MGTVSVPVTSIIYEKRFFRNEKNVFFLILETKL